MIITLREKNQITIPAKIVSELGLGKDDKVEVEVNDNGQIILTPVSILTRYEIEELKLVLNDIANGKMSEEFTAEELIDKLGLT